MALATRYVRVSKVDSLVDPPDQKEMWVIGYMMDEPKVGQQVVLYREMNERGQIPGVFSTSTIREIYDYPNYQIVATLNSMFKIENVNRIEHINPEEPNWAPNVTLKN